MSSTIEEAMKAAVVQYTVRGDEPDAGKKAVEEVQAPEDNKPSDINSKLSQYTNERFRNDVRQELLDMMSDVAEQAASSDGLRTALEYIASFKKMAKMLEEAEKKLVPYANAEFAAGIRSTGEASFRKNSPRRKWQYSKELSKLISEVEARKSMEQISGDALDVTPPVDITKSKMFAVSLKK